MLLAQFAGQGLVKRSQSLTANHSPVMIAAAKMARKVERRLKFLARGQNNLADSRSAVSIC